MRKKFALLALLLAGSVNAQYYSGNELLSRIRGNKHLAIGYVAGVADVTDGLGLTCVPGHSVTLGQLVDTVELRLINHPEIRHLPASALVQAALATAWPCKKGNSL